MTCVGGALMPTWAPEWLRPWLAQSQGIAICGIEYLMLVEAVLVLFVLLSIVDRSPA